MKNFFEEHGFEIFEATCLIAQAIGTVVFIALWISKYYC